MIFERIESVLFGVEIVKANNESAETKTGFSHFSQKTSWRIPLKKFLTADSQEVARESGDSGTPPVEQSENTTWMNDEVTKDYSSENKRDPQSQNFSLESGTFVDLNREKHR